MLTPRSLIYFFDAIERVFDPVYQPTEADIVHCRARTIGITETTFHLRDHEMQMVDVGGQKSERRKWIHCFQDVTSILFLVSLSGYDQCLVEDKDAVSRHACAVRVLGLLILGVESNARCYDDLGFDLSFTMVQTNLYRAFTPGSLQLMYLMVLQILFMNKNDLFEKKLPHSDIKNFFPVCYFHFLFARL